MTDTQTRETPDIRKRRGRGPLIGGLSFAAIVLIVAIGLIVANLGDSDSGVVAGPEDLGRLPGTSWEIATVAQSQSGTLSFLAGDRFELVRSDGQLEDAGSYSLNGAEITFLSEDGFGCHNRDGTYALVFSEAGVARFQVVGDSCLGRVANADGFQIRQIVD